MVSPAAEDDGRDAPILTELRLRLEASPDPIERSVLRVRQGLYLARTNRFAEAHAIPGEIRAMWDGQEQLRVFVWLWLLEGVLSFYETSATEGRQRLLQAEAAARRAGYEPELQLVSAWLAHLAYVANDFQAMLHGLAASCMGGAALEETRARSSLTLACALQLCGEGEAASLWFSRAREVSRRTGDRAGIMAASANRLMLKLNDNWLAFCFAEPQPHDNAALRQELSAILGYERLSGSESLREQNEVAQLRMAVLRGDEPGALGVARTMSAARDRRSAVALALAAVAEQWLGAHLAPPAQAREALTASQRELAGLALDDDDAATSLALMAQLAHRCAESDLAARLESEARRALGRFQHTVEELRPALRSLERDAVANWPGD